jgi:hypothetical protein
MNAVEIIKQRIKLLKQWRNDEINKIRESTKDSDLRAATDKICSYNTSLIELCTLLGMIKAGQQDRVET